MKAISIRQPWADAILVGAKSPENRSRRVKFRGDVLIHAGIAYDYDGTDFVMARFADRGLRSSTIVQAAKIERRGALLGIATIVDCVRASEVSDDDAAWAFGPWCIIFKNPQPFPYAIPYKGQLGLFNVPDATVASAIKALTPTSAPVIKPLLKPYCDEPGRSHDGLRLPHPPTRTP